MNKHTNRECCDCCPFFRGCDCCPLPEEELENLENFGLLVTGKAAEEDMDELDLSREQFIRDIVPWSKTKKPKRKTKTKLEKKYYRVNKNFILYEEVKALVIKAQVLYEKDFIEKLYKIGNPKLLILTGYFVNQPEKNVDLLMVGRINKTKLNKLIHELETELHREVNYTILSTQDFKFRRAITDIFLYDILEGARLTVIDDFGVS